MQDKPVEYLEFSYSDFQYAITETTEMKFSMSLEAGSQNYTSTYTTTVNLNQPASVTFILESD